MIDANLLLRTWLLSDSVTTKQGEVLTNPLTAVIDNTRVWGGSLPEGFDPSEGPGIVIVRGGSGMTSGGKAENEIPLTNPHVQVKVWAEENKFQVASEIYSLIHDWIDGRNDIDFGDKGYLMSCNESVEPQDLRDPETRFSTVFGYFDMQLRDSS